MKRGDAARRFPIRALAPGLVALCACSGCIAFNVGSPERFTSEFPAGVETRTTSRKALYSQPTVERDRTGTDVSVALHGVVERGEQKCRIVNEIDICRQKRMSFGFFPAAAERNLRPSDSARPIWFYDPSFGRDKILAIDDGQGPAWLFLGGPIVGLPLVPYALFVEPFAGNWDCGDHPWRNGGKDWISAPAGAGYRPYSHGGTRNSFPFLHLAPFGFFRHVRLEFSPERFKEARPISAATYVRETLAVRGPYRIDLSVPAIGFSDRREVGDGADRAEFRLPPGASASDAVALVRYRPSAAGLGAIRDESQRVLLEDAMRWAHVVPLGPLGAGARVVVAVEAARKAPIRYQREKDDANGRSVYRAEVLDETKDAFEIAAFVRPFLLEELREEFAERHPGLDRDLVRAWADYETEEDGATLLFSGAAFSVQPVADGWRYDDASRRGMVRLRLSKEAELADARRWARENVESIVRDRNAVLAEGSGPPPGAKYRSLSERFEDGVLVLEFEALE